MSGKPASEKSALELDDEADREELRDRYYNLMQELRVVLPGVQVLAAFLLTAPFAARFTKLNDVEQTFYAIALLSATLSVVAFITPTALHRLGPRTARSLRLYCSILATRVGIALLGVALLAALVAITLWLFGGVVAAVLCGTTGIAMVAAWIALPAVLRRENGRPPE